MKNKHKESRIPEEAYRKFASDIAHYNLNALRQISFVGMIGGIILVMACLPPFHLLSLIKGYFTIAVLFTLVFTLTCTVLKKHEAAVIPVYYAFVTLVLAIAILMGTWWGTTTNATTFVMLILMFPMLIIDRPYRIHIFSGAFCVVFCLADMNVKAGQLLDLDIANCIVFYLLSMIISGQTIRAKMSDIIVKHELKQQRDTDMLTKLSNRGDFERVVARYIHESNQNAVLMIMDIDHF
ncbi:MAG: hypothetical protein Q4F84_10620, partial [Fibrobacter sp.]|nr:hypothetical protein [Fibrobacter sp.]